MPFSRDIVRSFFRDSRVRGADLARRDMLWGYFFLGKGRPLAAARRALVRDGYRFVTIFADEDRELHLHVERAERHSAESMYQRCLELGEFGRAHRLASFDGDVGNVDGSVLY